MKVATILLAGALTQSAPTTIPLSPDQVAMCEAEGGCHIVTQKSVETLAAIAYAEGIRAGIEAAKRLCQKPAKGGSDA